MRPFPLALLVFVASAAPIAAQHPLAFDDTRLTEVGAPGDAAADATRPEVVWDPEGGLALVAWLAGGPESPPEETEVWARLLDPTTMEWVGDEVVVSEVGAVVGQNRRVFDFSVARNPLDGAWLFVWTANDPAFGLGFAQQEVFGRRVDFNGDFWDLSEVGPISESGGPGGLTDRDASQPAVAWGDQQEAWFVVWRSDNAGALLADNDFEIFGRRVSADFELLPGEARLSAMGPDGGAGDASWPTVVYHPPTDRFIVAWAGDNVGPGWAEGRHEIFAQRVQAGTGLALGDPERVSFSGATDDLAFQSILPTVVWNPVLDRLLFAWAGTRDAAGLSPSEHEIWAEEFSPSLSPVGGGTFRVSEMGNDGEASGLAGLPAVAWDSEARQYLIAWVGAHEILPAIVDGVGEMDLEIWGRSFRAGEALPAPGPQQVLSDLGGGSANPEAYDSNLGLTVAWLEGEARALVLWAGDDDRDGMVDDEAELFGEIVGGHGIFTDGFESEDASRWSDAL